MKIVVFTDTHANLPALRAAAREIRREGYDAAFHTGDAVGLGPWPAETIEALSEIPRLQLISGNHDAWMCGGVPDDAAHWLREHYLWLSKAVSRRHLSLASAWPCLTEHEFEGMKVAFVHYALSSCGLRVSSQPMSEPITSDLDALLGRHSSLLVFHGHRHKASDLKGKVRYINPGSLGCWHKPAARYALVRFHKGRAAIQHKAVSYDEEVLLKGFTDRKVPGYRQILASYFRR